MRIYFLRPKQAQQLVDIQLSNFRPQKVLLSKIVSLEQGEQVQKGEQIRMNTFSFSTTSGLKFPLSDLNKFVNPEDCPQCNF